MTSYPHGSPSNRGKQRRAELAGRAVAVRVRQMQDAADGRGLLRAHRAQNRPREVVGPLELAGALLNLARGERLPAGAEYALELRGGVHRGED